MKIILAVDAIFPPLTGIGRYAWELAHGLARHPEKPALRFFLHGRWVNNPTTAALTRDRSTQTDATHAPAGVTARLRSTLARSRMVVGLYAAITPALYRYRLRPYSDHLFHSPNYLLPDFDGASIATVHDLSTLLYPQFHPPARVGFMDRELPRTFRRATHIITDTEVVRQEVIAHFGWPADRISAIGLGVDPGFAPRPTTELTACLARFGLTAGAYVLCVATLEPRKNIARLLDAHALLPLPMQRRHPLVLAGSPGWHSDDLHRRIANAPADTVRYLRYVPEPELPLLYAGARVFAFPSLYEGFGLPVLEAMASGIPVVTSNCSTLPEVAGGAALLVNPLDTDVIASGLTRALTDDDWRVNARAKGLERAQLASWSRCIDETLEVYRRCAR